MTNQISKKVNIPHWQKKLMDYQFFVGLLLDTHDIFILA